MRLRTPRVQYRGEPEKVAFGKEEACERYRVRLITPLYGGGVKTRSPDPEMPIRLTGIAYQLRYWWRLRKLAELRGGGSADPQGLYRQLFEKERALWGAMAEPGRDHRSRVRLLETDPGKIIEENKLVQNKLVLKCQEPKEKTMKDGTKKWEYVWEVTTPDSSTAHLSGYALFPGQGDLKKGKDPAEIVFPGWNFILRIAFRDVCPEQRKEVGEALRCWASFSGIGGRSRRGLGSVEVSELDESGADKGPLPPVDEKEAEDCGCVLRRRPPMADAISAWKEAIDRLQAFRQEPGIARDGHSRKHPGRSRWPEADSIRRITRRHILVHAPQHPAGTAFPRAVFGLPIITHFKDAPRKWERDRLDEAELRKLDPEDTALLPLVCEETRKKTLERMASPLILKAMWTGSDPQNPYAPIALLLPRDHVATMGLELRYTSSQALLDRFFQVGDWWRDDARNEMTRNYKPNPLFGRSGDVLADFLDFFRER
jgi:CRISPR-associated protein Cmr1